MNLWDSAILGVVEGFTEFLPISSTGHLILTANILKLAQSEFLKSFEIAIQLGAIFSVLVLYGKELLLNFKIFKRTAVAFLPTAILGLVFYKLIKKFLLGNTLVVLIALFLGGIFLIVFELLHKPEGDGQASDCRSHKEKDDALSDISGLTYKQSFLIGIFQSLAMIPGVSRSAATIIGGLSLGLKRKTIVEFSFLLAIPTMLAACSLDLIKSANSFNAGDFAFLGCGFLVSFITALIAIKFLLRFIKNNNFIIFGVYRILAAIIYVIVVR